MSASTRVVLFGLLVPVVAFGQVVDGSFEGSTAGGTTLAFPWTASTGAVTVFPAFGCVTDPSLGFPVDGSNWTRITGGGGAATPSNFSFSFNIAQTFTTGGLGNMLHLDVAFATGEGPGSPFNDFLAVTLKAGTVTQTLLLLETATASFPNSECSTGLFATNLTSIDVDVQTLFSGVTSTTPLTLRVHCANGGDNSVPSFAFVDNVWIGTPPPPPVAMNWVQGPPGLWTLQVVSAAHPNAQLWNLFSLITLTPVGSGPVFGIHFNDSVVAQIVSPIGAHPFHVLLDGAGIYSFGPLPIPPGLSVDGVAIAVTPGFIESSDAKNFTF